MDNDTQVSKRKEKVKFSAVDAGYGFIVGAGFFVGYRGAMEGNAALVITGLAFLIQALMYYADRYYVLRVMVDEDKTKGATDA